jgi:hypothetical protein
LRKRQANKGKEVDLTAMVASGPSGAYEALQLYRSRAARLKSKNDFLEAIKSCVSGASVLLEHNYENAGAELATLFIDLLVEDNQQINDELRNFVFEVDSKFPVKSTHRVEFLKSSIKWTVSCGTKELGDPLLHTRLAECLWNNNDKNAAYHFAAGEAPGAYLEKIDSLEGVEARDRALTVGVVNFLALENLRDAFQLYHSYIKLQASKGMATKGDLVTFCDYVLKTSRRDAAPLFKTLVNTYASQLDFDDAVPTLLMGPVASRLFGIKPKVNPMMSMLQSMMS